VLFEPNARTYWHSHAGGQTLSVVAGEGQVVIGKRKAISIRPGDRVQIGPNQNHWHEATAESFMAHLAVTEAGPDEWDGPVTDDEYGQAYRERARGT